MPRHHRLLVLVLSLLRIEPYILLLERAIDGVIEIDLGDVYERLRRLALLRIRRFRKPLSEFLEVPSGLLSFCEPEPDISVLFLPRKLATVEAGGTNRRSEPCGIY